MGEKPVPTPSEDTAEFWEACNDGTFVVQRCTACGHERFYPAAICPDCWNTEWEDIELDETGTIESFSVVHRAPSEAFEDQTPYVVALITIRDDLTVMANVLADPEDVSIGASVEIVWEERDGQQLYQFELED